MGNLHCRTLYIHKTWLAASRAGPCLPLLYRSKPHILEVHTCKHWISHCWAWNSPLSYKDVLLIVGFQCYQRRRQWQPTPVLLPGNPWMEEPGRLQSMGSLRVGHDWMTSLSLFTLTHWGGKWKPTPVFLPGESQGWGILVGFCLWGRTESDMTEAT